MFSANNRFERFKKYIVLLMAILLLISSVACQGPGEVNSGVIPEDYEMEISGEITFTISNESGTASEAKAPQALVRDFEKKYPGVKVTIDESARSTYATRISSGEIGDVFWCDENDANTYKKQHNALMMLDYYMDKLGIERSNIYTGALMSGLIDGRLYMVPRNLGQQVLVYNADALTQAGITIPSGGEAMTWDYFKDICQRLTLSENGEPIQVGASFKLWWAPVWQAFASGWGGTWYDTVNKKVSFVSDLNVMKGFHEMFAACNEGWMVLEDVKYAGDKSVYSNLADYQRVFRTFGDMQWITRYGNSYDNKEINWDFCPFPAFPTHKVCANATGYVVYNRTSNPDAAAALALFFLTEEGQEAYHSTDGGNVPLLKSQANDDFWRMPGTDWENKNFDAFVSYPEAAIPGFVITVVPYEISEILDGGEVRAMFTEIINGTKSVEDVFTLLETKCNETWSKLSDF